MVGSGCRGGGAFRSRDLVDHFMVELLAALGLGDGERRGRGRGGVCFCAEALQEVCWRFFFIRVGLWGWRPRVDEGVPVDPWRLAAREAALALAEARAAGDGVADRGLRWACGTGWGGGVDGGGHAGVCVDDAFGGRQRGVLGGLGAGAGPGFDAVGLEHEAVEGGVFVRVWGGGAVVEVLARADGDGHVVVVGRGLTAGFEDFLLREALLACVPVAVVDPGLLFEALAVLRV